jgi:hypothetical protein
LVKDRATIKVKTPKEILIMEKSDKNEKNLELLKLIYFVPINKFKG